MQVDVVQQTFPLAGTFAISRGSKTDTKVVTVAISVGGNTGIAECVPYARYGESLDGVCEQISSFADAHPSGFDRVIVENSLKAGAARNALDCALWDLEAKQRGQRVWDLLEMPSPTPAVTVYTLSLDSPEAMGEAAREHAHRPMLKLKLGPGDSVACVQAVHAGAPNSRLVVDANEAWDINELVDAMPALRDAGVELIEQPLPAGEDDALAGIERLIPVAADESCHVAADIERLKGRYDVANIKLDKTGGLTEALRLKSAARNADLGIMVGCMMSSSLAMAPATLLTDGASVVDLDGPLWLSKDRDHALNYEDHRVHPPVAELWG